MDIELNKAGQIFNFIMDFDSPHKLGEIKDDDDEDVEMRWLKSNNVYTSCQNSEIVDTLESGMYEVFQDQEGRIHAAKFEPETDELYWLPNNHINDVILEINEFWKKSEKFKTFNIKHKRGIMLMGGPGTGKTSIINLLSSTLVKNGGLVFSVSNGTELSWFINFGHNHLRNIEPDRPINLIIEDIDKYMDNSSTESKLLNFLDGEDSLDHIVVIATTNRLDHLNDLLLRPSRFDHHIEVEKPNAEVREAYLIKKGLSAEKAKLWGKDTVDYSLAELKELFVSVELLDIDYEASKNKIKKQADNVSTTTFNKSKGKMKKVGFGVGDKS